MFLSSRKNFLLGGPIVWLWRVIEVGEFWKGCHDGRMLLIVVLRHWNL